MKKYFFLLFLLLSSVQVFADETKKSFSHYRSSATISNITSPTNIRFSGTVLSNLSFTKELFPSTSINFHPKTDAEIKIKVTHKNVNIGTNYGADIQLLLPMVKGTINSLNQSTRIFINGAYGEFSIGYQNGIETNLKVGSIIAGNPSMSANFNVDIQNNSTPFYTSTVMYTESIANLSNPYIGRKSRKFSQTLPMRFSFITPNFMGLKGGISYTPRGYNNATLHDIPSNERISNYNHIVSGGISYKYHSNNFITKLSLIGEYANAVANTKDQSQKLHDLHNLKSFEFGLNVDYLPINLRAAFSYGNLGKSGIEKSIDNDNRPTNYYYTLTLGKQFQRFYTSANYMKSKFKDYILKKLGAGLEYNFFDSQKINSPECKLFINYDRFFAYSSTKNIQNDINDGHMIATGLKINF